MAGLELNADEMFVMAEQIERNGAAFYRKAATLFAEKKELLNKLALMEDGHLKTFQQMHKEITERERELSASDPDGEAVQLARVMANKKVFDLSKNPSDFIRGDHTLVDVFQFAIGLEKDSILFYLGMKAMVGRAAGRDRIDLLINEELKHIAWLSDEMSKVS
jgi:rubrerythrin